jgi:hypothetical protein
MAMCGFNEKMLKGLTAFHEGLIEHGLKGRSAKNGETIDQAIKREVSDMTRLLLETHKISDTGKRILTESLAKYCLGFYLIIRTKGIKNHEEAIKKIGEYFNFMDSKYYSELEGKADDMEQLVKFLNEKEI